MRNGQLRSFFFGMSKPRLINWPLHLWLPELNEYVRSTILLHPASRSLVEWPRLLWTFTDVRISFSGSLWRWLRSAGHFHRRSKHEVLVHVYGTIASGAGWLETKIHSCRDLVVPWTRWLTVLRLSRWIATITNFNFNRIRLDSNSIIN